ncbi:hypothetical protein FRC11_014328, partial [Ceratobasidium sp. 423]
GHMEGISSVAFSPDGNLVVSGSLDKNIRIWDGHTRSPIGEPLKRHLAVVNSVSYSPPGGIIAYGSSDHTVRLLNTNTCQQVGEALRGHDDWVRSVAFSPGGDLIASGSDDQTIRLWDVHRGASVSSPFKGHTSWVQSVAFSPGGTRIVSSSSDNTIRVWDVERGKTVLGPLNGHTGAIRSVALSPDGSQIISGSHDKYLRLWDARIGNMIGNPYEGHTDEINSVAFSPNGIHIASGSNDRTVRVWDVRTSRQVDEPFEEHRGGVCSVAFSPYGRRIASGSSDRKVMIWGLLNAASEVENRVNMGLENDTAQPESETRGPTDQHTPTPQMFNQLLSHGCIDLNSQLDPEQDSAVLVNSGGVGDIWTSKLRNGVRIVVKAWRAPMIERCGDETLKSAIKDIHNWTRMKHKHIHQLMGVVMPNRQYLGLVTEWTENGNLYEYMRQSPHFDRHCMCTQVTMGLAYMHQRNVVHGNLKALNVLISSGGVAKLSNFGLSAISEACLPFSETVNSQTGSARWVAPELLSEEASKTKQSDVYALGMTMLEIITGNVPYPRCRWEFQVLSKVMQGGLPTRPSDLGDDEHGNQMWDLLMNCWNKNPDSRPPAIEVLGS